MAKMNPMFSFSGTFNGVTQVNSRLYGKHMRNRRGSVKPALINDSLKKSVELNKLANPVAKAVKDALDPFRAGLHDGSMWSRLVGLFKKHLREHPIPDLSILDGFELYKTIHLSANFTLTTKVEMDSGTEQVIRIQLTSSPGLKLEKYGVSGYRQTLVVIFFNAGFKTSTCSDQVMLPLEKEMQYSEILKRDILSSVNHQQLAQWPVPPDTKWILMTVKCEPLRKDEVVARAKIKGMSAVKVIPIN